MEKQKQSRRLLSLDALRGLICSLLWEGLLFSLRWQRCFRIPFFSGDSRADGTCGMERIWRITTRSSHCSFLLRVSRFRSH